MTCAQVFRRSAIGLYISNEGERNECPEVPEARSAPTRLSLERRHALFAEQPQRVHHAGMRDQTAGVELRQDAADAELLAEAQQPVDNALGRADDHFLAQRLVVVD